jgi:hypothetical protein
VGSTSRRVGNSDEKHYHPGLYGMSAEKLYDDKE